MLVRLGRSESLPGGGGSVTTPRGGRREGGRSRGRVPGAVGGQVCALSTPAVSPGRAGPAGTPLHRRVSTRGPAGLPGTRRCFPCVAISAPPGLGPGRRERGAFLPAAVETPSVLCGGRAGVPASHPAAAAPRQSLLGLDLLGDGTGAVCSLGREEPSMPGSGRLAGEPQTCRVPCAGGSRTPRRGVTHVLCSWTSVGTQNHAQELKHLYARGLHVTGDRAEVSRDVLAHSMWWPASLL